MSTYKKGPCDCEDGADSSVQDEKTKQFVWEVRQAGGKAAPPIDFNTFAISLATSTLFHMGQGPLPDGQRGEINLEMAHQTIDILAMLQEKTRNNLSTEESELICNVLYDLRVRYVKTLREVKAAAK